MDNDERYIPRYRSTYDPSLQVSALTYPIAICYDLSNLIELLRSI